MVFQLKNDSARPVIEGVGGVSETTPAVFPEVFT